MLLPTWPIPMFWAGTLAFFVISSIGSKLIVDSLNQKVMLDNRGWRLVCGMVLLVLFWIIFSLPTNTHTFFYKSVVRDVLVRDLTDTKGRLQNLESEGEARKIIDQEKADFVDRVNNLFLKFESQVRDVNNPGSGKLANKALAELEGVLGSFEKLKLPSNSLADINSYMEGMRSQKDALLASKLTVYDQRLSNINNGLDREQIKSLISNVEAVQKKMQELPEENNDEPTAKTSIILSQAYKIIDNYSDVLINEFENQYPEKVRLFKEEKKSFSGVSRTEKMRSVTEVWKDFFRGSYNGRGFVFWLIIAALVDVAGFIFFSIAFKREY